MSGKRKKENQDVTPEKGGEEPQEDGNKEEIPLSPLTEKPGRRESKRNRQAANTTHGVLGGGENQDPNVLNNTTQ